MRPMCLAVHGGDKKATEMTEPFSGSERCIMEIEGVVHDGVIVPDDATALSEGTRVRITPVPLEKPRPFGERFAQFKAAVPGLPVDLAKQHAHYRLVTLKR